MNFYYRIIPTLSTFTLLISICGLVYSQPNPEPFKKGLNSITEQSLQSQTEFLASDWFAGRETATAGAYMAADYIASQFKQIGLAPYFPSGTKGFDGYFQNVKLIATEPVSSKITVTKTVNNGRTSQTFADKTDFLLSAFSKDINIDADLFFGHNGLNQASFEQLKGSASGQVLIRIGGYPDSKDTTSLGYQTFGKMSESQLQSVKNQAAKNAGFIAVLEFNPENHSPVSMSHPNQERTPSEKTLHKRSSGIYKKQVNLVNDVTDQIPVFMISEDVINAIYPKWSESLNNPKIAKSATDKNIRIAIEINTNRQLIECRNVLAVIEGENKNEVIVAGAHYDHLGEYDGYIWNGADDNATGTVGIMALAKAFAVSGVKPKKTLIFAAWTAEERGLHGSTYFVRSYPNLKNIKYCLNYDMIGREADPETPNMNTSFIYIKTWEEAADLIRSANENLNLELSIRYAASENLSGGSDQAPFAQNKIPVMWFHTGGHPDYHGPYDHADKINYKKMSAIVKASFSVLWKLANE